MKEFYMNKGLFFILCFILVSKGLYSQVATSQQLIVTVTDDWNSNAGTVYLFDKTSKGWKKQRSEITVSIGRNGLGWGAGVHPSPAEGVMKREGDNRSPAGMFELEPVLYGLDPNKPEGVRLPYQPLTKRSVCVDDSASVRYNQIFEADSLVKDWKSAERMGRIDPDYKYVLVVRHNSLREKGKGSCIFFHINRMPTSGCTSMDEEDMLTLLKWLDPAKKTLIIQLPHSEYHRLRTEWSLPMLLNN